MGCGGEGLFLLGIKSVTLFLREKERPVGSFLGGWGNGVQFVRWLEFYGNASVTLVYILSIILIFPPPSTVSLRSRGR